AQDRVVRTWFERPGRRGAAGDRDAVPTLGAALGDHQVPVVADPVEVRRLRGLGVGRAGPDPLLGIESLPDVRVDADLRDSGDRAPAVSVVVPGEVRVDAADTGQSDRV